MSSRALPRMCVVCLSMSRLKIAIRTHAHTFTHHTHTYSCTYERTMHHNIRLALKKKKKPPHWNRAWRRPTETTADSTRAMPRFGESTTLRRAREQLYVRVCVWFRIWRTKWKCVCVRGVFGGWLIIISATLHELCVCVCEYIIRAACERTGARTAFHSDPIR